MVVLLVVGLKFIGKYKEKKRLKMANLKEIRKRIVSVQNTQKITRAMTMISASKLHRARLDIENSRYYNQTLKEMVLSLQQKAAEYSPFKKLCIRLWADFGTSCFRVFSFNL